MLIDWFTVGAQALNFLILVWLMKRYLYKPIRHAIDEREKRIAAELANADAKKAEAQKEHDEFEHKNAEFDQQRAALLSKATGEAQAERERLLEEARKAALALSSKRQDALRSEEHHLHLAIRRRTLQEVFAIARKALTDLATVSLEERLGEVFTRRLREMDGKAKESLGAALKESPDPAVVRSTFVLPAEQCAAIQNALNETFSAEIRVRFETAPDLISGIELTTNGQKVAWSIADYLASLEKDFVDALFKECEVIRNAPNQLLSIRGELDSADQVRRGFESDVDFRREGVVERLLDHSTLLPRQVKCAAYERGVSRCLEGRGEACFRLAVHLPQAASEYLPQTFLQTRRGEIRQRLSRDGKHFLLGPATDGVIEVMGVVSQRVLAFGTQRISRLSRFVEEPLTFGLRLVRRLAQECGALPVELLVLALELVVLLFGFHLFRGGVGELSGDPLLPLVDGMEDRFVQEALQQPHQNEEVDDLRNDGKPVNQHDSLSRRDSNDVVPKRVRKDENHRDHEAINRNGLDHGQAHK